MSRAYATRMLSDDTLADLAFEIHERLLKDRSVLPLDLMARFSDARERSQLAAMILAVGFDYHDDDLDWLKTRLEDASLVVLAEDRVQLLRNVFQKKVEMRQRVAWKDFDDFGFSSSTLKLSFESGDTYLGQQLTGDIRLEERVAAGGVCVVYRGFSSVAGRSVAVRVPRAARATRRMHKLATRVRAEAQALSLLNVAGIPARLDFIEADCGPVLITEWVESTHAPGIPESLALDQKIAIVRDIARVLEQVHQQDLIHGDVKLENILVDANAKPWLLDFNVARDALPPRFLRTRRAGTRGMMTAGARHGVGTEAGISQDIYALGFVLYEVLCGQAAADRQKKRSARMSRRWMTTEGDAPFPKDVPSTLAAICQIAIQPYAELRFDTMADLANAFERYLAADVGSPTRKPCRPALCLWNAYRKLLTSLRSARATQSELESLRRNIDREFDNQASLSKSGASIRSCIASIPIIVRLSRCLGIEVPNEFDFGSLRRQCQPGRLRGVGLKLSKLSENLHRSCREFVDWLQDMKVRFDLFVQAQGDVQLTAIAKLSGPGVLIGEHAASPETVALLEAAQIPVELVQRAHQENVAEYRGGRLRLQSGDKWEGPARWLDYQIEKHLRSLGPTE